MEYYTEQNGTPPAEDEANAWTTGQVVAAAVEAVGCADPDPECQQQLIDWLRENEVDTVVGPLTWDAEGRPQGAHLIQQYVDGEIRIVLPEEPPRPTSSLEKPRLVTGSATTTDPDQEGTLPCPCSLQSLVLGVLLGGLYALLAAGLTLYFGVMRVVMIAHSAFLILAAYLAWFFTTETGLDPLLSLRRDRPAVLRRWAWLMQRLLISRLRPATLTMMSVLLTFSIALVIEGMLGFVFSGTQRRIRLPYGGESFEIFGANIAVVKLIAFGLAAARSSRSS